MAAGGGTYRTLDEIQEKLSPAEERFERARRTAGLFAAPLLALIVFFLTAGLTDEQQRLSAILTLVIVLWITEAIPIPVAAVVGMALCVLTGVADDETVFGAFGSSTIFVFVGSFIIAEAMMRHGLHRRFAFGMLGIKGVARSSYTTIIMFGVVAMVISAFVSNTATTAMLLPIAIGVVTTLTRFMGEDVDPQRLRFSTAVMLMVAYGASVGGLLTPIGSPPNLLGRDFIEKSTGENIPFFTWVLNAAPIVLLMFAALCVILIFLNRPEQRHIEGAEEFIAEERRRLGSLSRGEINTLIAFAAAVTLWIIPGVIALVAGDTSDTYKDWQGYLNEGTVAVLAASLLFVLPVDWSQRRFTLTWNEAVRIDWGTIILFGAGITLGSLMGAPSKGGTGLAKELGEGIRDLLGVQSLLGITILAVVVAVVISETTSNTASVGIVVPIILPIAADAGVNPMIPALAAVFGASYGFMLPVSTPPNAIVYGSGMVPITKMARSGFVFDLVGIVLIVSGVTVTAQLTGLA